MINDYAVIHQVALIFVHTLDTYLLYGILPFCVMKYYIRSPLAKKSNVKFYIAFFLALDNNRPTQNIQLYYYNMGVIM